MNRVILGAIALVFLIAGGAWATEPLPSLPSIPADNSLTRAKVELGKMLFFDPRLSSSGVVSCATCHNPSFAFTDRVPRALGHKHQAGPRNTPTVLNSAFLTSQFWDGRAATLEEQALGPIQAEVEMNESLENMVKKLKANPAYVELFKSVFGGRDSVNSVNVARAIAAFERTLITPNSPFDRYLRGDKEAISKEAEDGWALFQKKGCVACHNGPNFTDGNFYMIRVPGSTDVGRFAVTKKDEDKYKFRVQTLRNVALTYPYFNNGSVETLGGAVKVMSKEMLGSEATDQETALIVEFLKTLTGEMPRVDYPVLP